MQLEILTLCREARYNGQVLDIAGAFDIFVTPRMPLIVPTCWLAGRVRFERIEEGDHQLKLMIMDADGRLVVPEISEDLTVQFARDLPTVCKAFAIQFNQLVLPEHGEYAIKVAVDRISLASVPIYVLPPK
ncbi:MAG TPA: hypothetical protein VK163_01080 [Opitutaceae bacterium]|nr:hypothetical protein [Opitutaceae bacterium]